MKTEKRTAAAVADYPLRAIRRACVPLAAIETADPAATTRACLAALNGKAKGAEAVPLVSWDICNGLAGMNQPGAEAVSWYDPQTMPLPEILKGLGDNARNLKGALVFLFNVHRFFERDGVVQGIWNLRDKLKAVGATCLMVGPSFKLPAELQSDVVQITEPVPDRAAVDGIIDSTLADATKAGASMADVQRPAVASALLGLQSAFDVEQTLALSLRKDGVDVPGAWQRKITRLKSQTGAEITVDNPTFEAVAGCENVKAEMRAFINGRQKPGVVLFMDEIEKLFAGAGTDLSGVSTNLVGMFLTWTAERRAKGFLLPGVPGAGKTWTATCAAGEAGVPLFKLADMKASLVGESEGKLRSALAAVDALAGDGSVLMIASCNWVDNISPDIMARFTMGSFFYDFPSAEERAALWRMYAGKLELPEAESGEFPESAGWVGREIENACWRAWQYRKPLAEVAANICPSAVSQKTKLENLRKSCDSRFLSASAPGLFRFRPLLAAEPAEAGGRAMKFE